MLDAPFDPADWHWQVAGRDDFWSSASASYVEALPDGLRGPVISTDDVNSERERRIAAGATVAVAGAGDIPIQGREIDVRNLQGLGMAALARIMIGDTTPFTFHDAENVDHDLTPTQMLELWKNAAAYTEALYGASWAIKALDPIPADFDSDGYWVNP